MPQQVGSSGRGAERLGLGRAFEEFPVAKVGAIGLDILPIFTTAKQAAAFSTVTRESILRSRNVKRAAGSAYSRDTYDVDELTYACTEKGHEQPVDDSNRSLYANDFNADEVAQAMISRVLRVEQEKIIEALIFNTTTWPSGTAALYTDVTTDWDDVASTIVLDVLTASEKVRNNCGLTPNTIVIAASHIPHLLANTDIKARLQYTQMLSVQVLLGALPALLNIPKVLFGGAVYNSGGEGDTLSIADVWDDDSCWIGVTSDGSGDLAQACAGRTFLWTDDSPENVTFDWYREEQTRSDVWRGRQHTHEKVFDAYFAHRLKIDT